MTNERDNFVDKHRLPGGQAEACYRKVLTLDANHVSAFNQLGRALELQGRNEEALEMFKKAVALVPGHPQRPVI